jgi:hypothetical protein
VFRFWRDDNRNDIRGLKVSFFLSRAIGRCEINESTVYTRPHSNDGGFRPAHLLINCVCWWTRNWNVWTLVGCRQLCVEFNWFNTSLTSHSENHSLQRELQTAVSNSCCCCMPNWRIYRNACNRRICLNENAMTKTWTCSPCCRQLVKFLINVIH